MFKRIILVVFIALFTHLQAAGCKAGDRPESAGEGGQKAAEFSLPSVDGKTVKLSDYKGKIVIVDFWATWCPPCRRGIPDLIALQNEYKNDLVVLGISVDQRKSDVPGFVKAFGINYPILYANSTVVEQYGGISSIPTAFVIDRNGAIVDSHVGLVDKSVYVNVIEKIKASSSAKAPAPGKNTVQVKNTSKKSDKKK